MRVLFLAAILLCTVIAGCAEPKNAAETCDEDVVLCDPETYFGDHFCEINNVRPRVYAPDTAGPDTAADPWVIGDFWTYSLSLDGEKQPDTKLIYYGIQDGGSHYMVGTPTRDEALQHALFSTNPVIGRVHRTLYSPHESGAHADMFQFPLCAGSTWTDHYFGTQFEFAASRQTIALPGGLTDPLGFRIDGTAADGSTVTHTYSPKAKWFTRIDLDRVDGTRVDMELKATGSGQTGSAYFLRGQQDEVRAIESSGSGNEIFTVNRANTAGYTSIGIALELERTSGTGRVELHVVNPAGTSVACIGIPGSGLNGATNCPAGPLTAEVPFVEGDWQVELRRPLGSGERAVAGEARLVSIADRSCTIGGNCGA